MSTHRHRRTAPAAVLLSLSLFLAACGSGGSDSGSGGGADSSAGVSYATKKVAGATGLPTFTAPGPAFDVSKVKGKRIFVIPAASNEFDNTIQAQMKKIAKDYGVDYTSYTNQGSPNEWVSGFNTALSQKPDLIVLNTALDPNQVKAQIKLAKDKGIPVLATHFFDQAYAASLGTKCGGTQELCDTGLTATVNAPFNEATRIEADHIIADSKGKGHVLLISANDAAPSSGMVAAAKKEFADHCSGCDLTVQNISVGDWATKIQPQVQAALAKDPQLNYIMPIFDFGASFAASGINAAGKAGTAKIVTYNGTQNVLALLQKGGAVQMDVGEPLNWLGYAFMDQAFRLLAGEPAVDQKTPIRAFTKGNVDEAGTPPAVDKGYGDAYVQGYRDLWKTAG
jgi:ribose transport system substrate-binding protein